jgi:hypothetical protein|uniref:Uncharacterized protein n=1 Tax=viral metagenome TaxID=1070528 RepID=A0A6C0DX99_9ZZZZ
MESKEHTIQCVKEWVKLDNDIRALQSEINSRKKRRTQMSTQLMKTMKETNTDCFELKNGVLLYSVKNVKKPITKKVLFDILNKYYNGDFMKASELNDFILENREEITKESLVYTESS